MTLKSEQLRQRVEFALADRLDKLPARVRNLDYHRGPISQETYVPASY